MTKTGSVKSGFAKTRYSFAVVAVPTEYFKKPVRNVLCSAA